MKKSFTLVLVLILTIGAYPQAPEKMSYQAIIRDVSNLLRKDQNVGMQISILKGSATGTPVYVETQTPTTNDNGLAIIEIGGGTVVSGTFEEIDWSDGTYFIKTETDPTGGIDYTITGTSQILSVPYALYAKTAGDLDSLIVKVKLIEDKLIEEGILKLTDIEGNQYSTVKIGTQLWMAENLKSTKFNDGSLIPFVTVNTEWQNLSTSGYCWYGNEEVNKNIYGALYNFNTVTVGKLCPIGWHIPSDAEWTVLTNYLGGESVAGGYMKDTGTTHWISPNVGATNTSGFTGLPGGMRYVDGTCGAIGHYGYFWAITEFDELNGLARDLDRGDTKARRTYAFKKAGLSVRCIKD